MDGLFGVLPVISEIKLGSSDRNHFLEREAYVRIQIVPLHGGQIGEWCNGSTADFESVNPGSNPGSPA
jgi:hypothetical protein